MSTDLHPARLRDVVVIGLLAAVAAVVLVAGAAALALALGVDFEITDGGESIPVSGFAVVTSAFCLVGVVIALGLARWSASPARRFVQVTIPLTAVSLVPPFLAGANPGTTASLVSLHLLAGAVMIPAVARGLRTTSI